MTDEWRQLHMEAGGKGVTVACLHIDCRRGDVDPSGTCVQGNMTQRHAYVPDPSTIHAQRAIDELQLATPILVCMPSYISGAGWDEVSVLGADPQTEIRGIHPSRLQRHSRDGKQGYGCDDLQTETHGVIPLIGDDAQDAVRPWASGPWQRSCQVQNAIAVNMAAIGRAE